MLSSFWKSLTILSLILPQILGINSANWICPSICVCGLRPGRTERTLTFMDCHLTHAQNITILLRGALDQIGILTIRNSRLETLMPLNHMHSLRELDLSLNKITSVLVYESYAIYDQLIYLNVSHNRISALKREEFIAFPNLEILDLSNNQISALEEHSLRLLSLKRLYLHKNRILTIADRVFRFTPLLQELDLSTNSLGKIAASKFYYLRNLKILNLSQNSLAEFENSASVLPIQALEVLNLSHNRFERLDMKPFGFLYHLRELILDGNPIGILQSGQIYDLPVQTLHLSNMPELTMVLASAVTNLQNLTTVFMQQNPKLCHISPAAFTDVPRLKELRLAADGLTNIPKELIAGLALDSVSLAGNPFDCSCGWDSKLALKISDARMLTCLEGNTAHRYKPAGSLKTCEDPLCSYKAEETFNGFLGSDATFYCTLGSNENSEMKLKWVYKDQISNRVVMRENHMLLANLKAEDSGQYDCVRTVRSKVVEQRSFWLKVVEPDMMIYPLIVGDHYAIIQWNQSTNFQDMHNFELFYRETTAQHWVDALSLGDFYSTNRLYGLRASTNYTICVAYKPHGVALYEYCTELTTLPSMRTGVGISIDYPLIAAISSISSVVIAVCIARCVYKRFHVWQREKWHSRMQESLSAQGFFSSFDSLNQSNVAITYENTHMDEAGSEPSVEETTLFFDGLGVGSSRSSCCSARSTASSTINRNLNSTPEPLHREC